MGKVVITVEVPSFTNEELERKMHWLFNLWVVRPDDTDVFIVPDDG